MTPNRSDEIKQLMPKIDNIHTLAGLLSTQDLTKEHPEYALMFLQRAFELGQQELEAVKREYWMAARRAKDGTTIGMDYTEGHGPAFSTLETYEQFKQAQGGE